LSAQAENWRQSLPALRVTRDRGGGFTAGNVKYGLAMLKIDLHTHTATIPLIEFRTKRMS
jgi:hypothetical protein